MVNNKNKNHKNDSDIQDEDKLNNVEDLNSQEETEKEVEDINSEENQPLDELSELKEKNARLQDSYLRLNAEFDNFRKRSIKEKGDLLRTATEKIITEILPVIDNMERALDNIEKSMEGSELTEQNKAMLDGVKIIHNDILRILSNNNVKEIDTVGQEFDVDRHEALTTVPAQDDESKNKIIDCIQKGYCIGDKIIRYPKVIVAK